MGKIRGRYGKVLETLKLYRQNLLQVNRFSEVFQLANGGSYVLEIAATVLCIYGSIRLHGLLSILGGGIALNGMVFAVGLVSALAEVNQGSKHTLQCFRNHAGAQVTSGRDRSAVWYQKCVMQLPELKIYFGFICHYDKRLVLVTVQLILVNSATLLLTV